MPVGKTVMYHAATPIGAAQTKEAAKKFESNPVLKAGYDIDDPRERGLVPYFVR